MNKERVSAFLEASENGMVDQFLSGLDVLQLHLLKGDLGLIRIGEAALMPFTPEEKKYDDMIDCEQVRRTIEYANRSMK